MCIPWRLTHPQQVLGTSGVTEDATKSTQRSSHSQGPCSPLGRELSWASTSITHASVEGVCPLEGEVQERQQRRLPEREWGGRDSRVPERQRQEVVGGLGLKSSGLRPPVKHSPPAIKLMFMIFHTSPRNGHTLLRLQTTHMVTGSWWPPSHPQHPHSAPKVPGHSFTEEPQEKGHAVQGRGGQRNPFLNPHAVLCADPGCWNRDMPVSGYQ